jgi:hypothetical protein
MQTGNIVWQPQPGPQSLAIAAHWCPELMFGGARGGGKSDFLLGDYMQDIGLGPAWRGILFRKSYAELEELVTRAHEIYLPLGAQYQVAKSTFLFPSGATLKMRYLEHERDAAKYQGHQYTWAGWDELTNWASDAAYMKIKACVRSAHGIPNKRIRCSANPGGVGHHWVKSYYVDHNPLGMELIEGKRMFIPSKLTDNTILMSNDPEYIETLKELGSPELVRAWLDGDWDVITGCYFPEFRRDVHVLEPFELPKHLTRFRSCDWGSAKPFSVGWWAVSVGIWTPDGKYLSPGAIIRYREWYGCKPGKPNTGIRKTGNEVGRGIKEREKGDNISYGVIDPSAYKQDGGPSIAERMAVEGVIFRKADNQRIPGWDQVRDRLKGDEDTGPMMYFFSNCRDTIRTLPGLQHDETNPEDVNTDGEDHAGDDVRYACMSRPYKRVRTAPKAPEKTLSTATLNDLYEVNELQNSTYRQI